ncbi:MAG: hypothetical protein R3C53_12025 [Pirellulaceae bacterium]
MKSAPTATGADPNSHERGTLPEEFQQYKVPREDRSALIDPAVDILIDQLQTPFDFAGMQALEFCGKALNEARQHARDEVIELARSFTAKYRNINGTGDPFAPIVMSGHQPELFHPGVWYKNFLLSHLSQRTGAIAINFLVDNDVCRKTAIRVPSLAANNSIVTQTVAFDSQREGVPWEQRRLNSWETWHAFPEAVKAALIPGDWEPLVDELWPDATESLQRTNRLGLAIAEARHKLEARLGLNTLEVPLSDLVGTRAFARFSIQLLSELPRFQDVYNLQLQRYREAHHIRNHAHPVPALDQDAGWLEAPWWIYRASAPQRKKMWVRLLNDQLILSDRAGWQAVIEGRLDCDNAATQWLELLSDGICIRPRALLTTMYLRIMVSDLFIHGIGGGKYDQLTNAIMREFFAITPPPMAVATATLRLPLSTDIANDWKTASAADTADRIRTERQQIWQLKFNADKFSDVVDERLDNEVTQLTERKAQLLANIPERGNKWEWHNEITAINGRLRELSTSYIGDSRQTIDKLNQLQRQQKILESREFSFCLFPKDYIADALEVI